MGAFRTVAKVSDVQPGQLRRVQLDDGAQVCLANVEGTIYAIGGACTHEGGPLAEGELEGTTITCPWHGAMFDVTTGELQGPPADSSVLSYEVRIQGDDVQVDAERIRSGAR